MKIENLCINCMMEKVSPGGKCEHCGFDPSTVAIPSHHLAPFVILEGKYLVGKAIGQGGFGITYIGMDLNLEMRVAIKEYYPNGCAMRDTSDNSNMVQSYSEEAQTFFEIGREKFINEAKILAKCINLSEIVKVKDFFKENHTAYIVMEYLEGETLKEYLKDRGGRISLKETLNMMKPLIKSLSQVHKMNLIHRDISPDNLMITAENVLKILDFGGARDYVAFSERSMSITLKPGYAPEEQYRTHGEQGPWTDVYALCATMYRCITGQIPPESMERAYQDTLKPITDFVSDCPQWIDFVIQKGLGIYKNDRWQSMQELYENLYNEQNVSIQEKRTLCDTCSGKHMLKAPFRSNGIQYYLPKKVPITVGVFCVVLLVLLVVFGLKNYNFNYRNQSDSEDKTAWDKTESSEKDKTFSESKSLENRENSKVDEASTPDKTPVPTPTEVPTVAKIDMTHIENILFDGKESGAQESMYIWDCLEECGRGTDLSRMAMPATGMVSIPILYTTAVKIQSGELSLDSPVTFKYIYAVGGGNLRAEQDGQQLSVNTLLQSMMMYSDNNATNSMIDFLTMEGIQQTCHEHNFESVLMRRKLGEDGDDNMISSKDAAKMIQKIFDNQFSVINRDYLINYMRISDDTARYGIFQSDTLYNDGSFCNQNGVKSDTYAEVGIVMADEKQYIVCVMADLGNEMLAASELSDAVQYVHSCM